MNSVAAHSPSSASSSAASPAAGLGQRLSNAAYVRERTQPGLTSLDYLMLKDLYALLKSVAPEMRGDVFDYGCGGAPYAALFAHCRSYVKADVTPAPGIDRVLLATGLTNEPEASYDWVVSTQVLEHVENARLYFDECRRLLRPGGQLLLTTHGMVQEHGCPYDFQRWTARGLETLAAGAGFEIVAAGKCTVEVRAAVQILHHLMLHLRAEGRPWLHYPMAVLRNLYRRLVQPALNLLAGLFPHQAIVPGSDPASLYMIVYVRARKVCNRSEDAKMNSP